MSGNFTPHAACDVRCGTPVHCRGRTDWFRVAPDDRKWLLLTLLLFFVGVAPALRLQGMSFAWKGGA